jgi:hypothetical protein
VCFFFTLRQLGGVPTKPKYIGKGQTMATAKKAPAKKAATKKAAPKKAAKKK